MKTPFEELYENDPQVKQLSVTQDVKLQKLEMDLDAQARTASMGQLKPMPKPRGIPFSQNTYQTQQNIQDRKLEREREIKERFDVELLQRWEELKKEHPELSQEHERLREQHKQQGKESPKKELTKEEKIQREKDSLLQAFQEQKEHINSRSRTR